MSFEIKMREMETWWMKMNHQSKNILSLKLRQFSLQWNDCIQMRFAYWMRNWEICMGLKVKHRWQFFIQPTKLYLRKKFTFHVTQKLHLQDLSQQKRQQTIPQKIFLFFTVIYSWRYVNSYVIIVYVKLLIH